MVIKRRYILGDLKTNCYLIEHMRKNILIDAGCDIQKVIDFLQENNMELDYVFITHVHYDHIGGLNDLVNTFSNVQVVVNKNEAQFLTDIKHNLSELDHQEITYSGDFITYDELDCDALGLEVIPVRGHSYEGVCLYFKDYDAVFTGDTLFRHTIGRSDFIDGNHDDLIHDIKYNLLTLPGNTSIYPGHGFGSTISEEIANNPKLKEVI